jgi:hypothetical protein
MMIQPGSSKYVQIVASDPDAKVLLSGDMTVNPGIWVRQAIASAPRSYGKYTNVALEKWTFREMMNVWSEVTGHDGSVLQCTAEEWTELWGLAGKEVCLFLPLSRIIVWRETPANGARAR